MTATLNTDLLPKEARDEVISLFPTLKTDSDTNERGIEKVTGDYEEVEKLFRYLERRFGCFPGGREVLQPASQNGLEERDVAIGEEHYQEGESDMQVPPAILEYFYIICQEQVNELEQKFNVKLLKKGSGSSGMMSVQFIGTPAGSPNGIKKAQQVFVESIQKLASDLTQEKIPFPDSQHCTEAQAKLNTCCKKVLVKRQNDTLIICGPAREIAAAKELEEVKVVGFPKRLALRLTNAGIEVDADVFELLEPGLVKEIEAINQKYDTVMEKKTYLSNRKVLIHFKSRKEKNPDRLQQVHESFCIAYERAFKTPMEKVIPLPLSVDQKRRLQKENLRVQFKEAKEGLIITGYPEYMCVFEKHIKKFLNENDPAVPADQLVPVYSSTFGATSRASTEQKRDHKQVSFPSRPPPSTKAAGVTQEKMCTICMDKIGQKKVLPKCKHEFCRECIDQAMRYKPVCPVCNVFYGVMEGNQPPGTMQISKDRMQLPGYEGSGTIVISYCIPDGYQTVGFECVFSQPSVPFNHAVVIAG